jgi:preprotein translocase subunit SecD
MVNAGRVLANRKVQFALLALALSLGALFLRDLNPATLDVNYGIEFIGGVRIPVSLEERADPATMAVIVDTLKQRINKYGLAQSVVRPLGDQEVIVEIPRANPAVIASIESILKEQGHFEAVIDGKVALRGEDVLTSAVGGAQGERVTPGDAGSFTWELDFAVSRQGGERFAQASRDKGNFPVYMFLDRPSNAVLLLSRSRHLPSGLGAERALQDALRLEGDDLLLFYEEDLARDKASLLASNRTLLVLSEEFRTRDAAAFAELNRTFRLRERTEEEMTPSLQTAGAEQTVSRWEAVGLLSGPTLSPGLAGGFVSQFYSVSGGSSGATPDEAQAKAVREIRELKSVISGGRLPVATSIGSAYTVAASLGESFLFYSAIGLVLASLGVSSLIVLRYRQPKLIFPIILTNVSEIVILTGVVGTIGTIDLAAMAGIITLIGQGVDDQIVIADEVLRRRSSGEVQPQSRERETKDRVARAFRIVVTVASVSVITMLPLLLSGIVEITGFALAAIIGVLVGVVITRPAFGVLIEEMFGH